VRLLAGVPAAGLPPSFHSQEEEEDALWDASFLPERKAYRRSKKTLSDMTTHSALERLFRDFDLSDGDSDSEREEEGKEEQEWWEQFGGLQDEESMRKAWTVDALQSPWTSEADSEDTFRSPTVRAGITSQLLSLGNRVADRVRRKRGGQNEQCKRQRQRFTSSPPAPTRTAGMGSSSSSRPAPSSSGSKPSFYPRLAW